ncbi:MAG: hypothetical protein A2428_13075 [Bdellovibrionales bacterium RIFOXYC1_FULL_54_43]|nr:MAG: hypothetical protein A2428_13075 [Bdellovibrionales bacterium RIFOXYC1_FULL_54_43]OFZ83854.1 MAG: hypothetical protein A2603_08985 [Bdellovibrionales bacterium RIFOXYD1_FULL_55_31]
MTALTDEQAQMIGSDVRSYNDEIDLVNGVLQEVASAVQADANPTNEKIRAMWQETGQRVLSDAALSTALAVFDHHAKAAQQLAK